MGGERTPEILQKIEEIHERSRQIVCNPRDVIEEKRPRAVDDIRSALTNALSDRASSPSASTSGGGIDIEGLVDQDDLDQWST